MKRVVSFSLWGADPVYWNGALANARLAAALLPGWECRYYVAAEGVPPAAVAALAAQPHARIERRPGAGDAAAMFWRFEPADDPDVAVLISRDADSRLSPREVRAVEAWLASGRRFHVMRDHPFHRAAMLGGMWGCRSTRRGDMRQWIERWLAEPRTVRKGLDQAFLRERVWPEARGDCVVHDPFFSGRRFPGPGRDAGGVYFVGECFTADDRPASADDREAVRAWERRWRGLAWTRRFRPVRF